MYFDHDLGFYVEVDPLFWSLPMEKWHLLNKSQAGTKVLQKVLGGRQYFYSPTNNYWCILITIIVFSWRWTILSHKIYYFCNPSLFCILVLKFIVFRVPDASFASFCDLGAPFGMCLVPFSDLSQLIWLIQRMWPTQLIKLMQQI